MPGQPYVKQKHKSAQAASTPEQKRRSLPLMRIFPFRLHKSAKSGIELEDGARMSEWAGTELYVRDINCADRLATRGNCRLGCSENQSREGS